MCCSSYYSMQPGKSTVLGVTRDISNNIIACVHQWCHFIIICHKMMLSLIISVLKE